MVLLNVFTLVGCVCCFFVAASASDDPSSLPFSVLLFIFVVFLLLGGHISSCSSYCLYPLALFIFLLCFLLLIAYVILIHVSFFSFFACI